MTYKELLFTWVGAFLTICIFSFLYKDNPLYKFAEHLMVGVSAGYIAIIYFYNFIVRYLWLPLSSGIPKEILLSIPPLILGFLFYTRFTRQYGWLSRWSMAFYLGVGNGLAIPRTIEQRLLKQSESTMLNLWGGDLSIGTLFNNWVIFIGVLATLIYFFFSKEHKGTFGFMARIGIIFIMIGFGASFGYTVMGRVSLLIGRVGFLLSDWLHII
ncbi:hypothetical protein KKB18_11705 [bacterium]|nr:hypothetical protein [bacterium]